MDLIEIKNRIASAKNLKANSAISISGAKAEALADLTAGLNNLSTSQLNDLLFTPMQAGDFKDLKIKYDSKGVRNLAQNMTLKVKAYFELAKAEELKDFESLPMLATLKNGIRLVTARITVSGDEITNPVKYFLLPPATVIKPVNDAIKEAKPEVKQVAEAPKK